MQNNLTPRYIVIAVILGWAIWSLWPTYQYQSMSEERKEELRESGELEQVESKIIIKNLKIACGTGGAVKGDFLELQGDQISKAQNFLLKEGFRPKQSGG